ncbi:MAG: DUF3842 family protein [Oscillospiraceae bacterium]|nr:DUF3842 family protein [Oscillospiraceae bacterium]
MKKKIVIIDGQGGRIGSMLIERIRSDKAMSDRKYVIYAIGTNSIAASAMIKAGADFGAAGENPAVINCRDADIIIGPLGILAADSLLGEITPAMAVAVGQSPAQKILLPINKCGNYVVGTQNIPIPELIEMTVDTINNVTKDN